MAHKIVIRWLTVSFALFLAAVVMLADLGLANRLIWLMEQLPGKDFTGHVLLLGILSFLVNLSLNAARFRVGPLRVLKGSVIIAVVFTVEEFSQQVLSARGFSLRDLAANYLGIGVFGALAAWLHARWSRQLEEHKPL